jgi:hypothetical protein
VKKKLAAEGANGQAAAKGTAAPSARPAAAAPSDPARRAGIGGFFRRLFWRGEPPR